MIRHATRFLICLLAGSFSLGAAEARAVIGEGDVVVVPLQGEVSPSLALFLRRAQKAAEREGATAIVFGDTRFSWAAWNGRINQLAHAFRAHLCFAYPLNQYFVFLAQVVLG
jgi:non-ribosomal peptide synthetase component F